MFDFIYILIGCFVSGYFHKNMIRDEIDNLKEDDQDTFGILLFVLVIGSTALLWPLALAFHLGTRKSEV